VSVCTTTFAVVTLKRRRDAVVVRRSKHQHDIICVAGPEGEVIYTRSITLTITLTLVEWIMFINHVFLIPMNEKHQIYCVVSIEWIFFENARN